MKVLFITPAYFPNLRGGNERSIKIIAEGLANKDISVAVLSFDAKNNTQEEHYKGVKVIRVKKLKISPNTLAHNLSLLKCRNLIEKEHPDIIHVFNTWHIPAATFFKDIAPLVVTLNNYFPIIATAYTKDNIIESKKSNLFKVVHSIKGTIKGDIVKRYLLGLFYGIYSIFVRFYSKRADKYIVYASPIGKIYYKWGFDKRKFVTISSPVEKNKIQKTIKRDKKSVLYVGGAYEAKGFYELLEATKYVKTKDVQFYFVGINTVPEKVKEFVKNNNINAYFIRKLDALKLVEYYKKSSVLIHPSIWPEPFSRVWIEALQYNIPIISADNPVALEILKGAAIFYHRGEPKELATRIDSFFKSKIKLDQTKAKRKIFESNPVKRLIEVYNNLLKNNS
ncbi:glycosyltransferase family 4 protein [Candidatus Pacearchaeota archaeon]|nr:glycosyltransferase family 4 protein [Candidatus Pacearchaeota archaeon]